MNMKITKKQNYVRIIVINLLIVLALSLASFVQPANAESGKCKFKHKVKAGETVTTIANLYGISYLEVAEANDLEPPYVIYVDQVLCIPGGTKPEEGTTPGTGETNPSNKQKGVYVDPYYYYFYLEAVSLVHNNVYNVLISKVPGWSNTKITRIKTDKNGNYTGYVSLHERYPNTRMVRVCLKDVWMDDVECTEFQNPYYYTGNPAWYWRTFKP